ncbi:MAG: ABC transporter ATP-binding protein [Chloroflexota bacterium]|nr:ABC transporter ATP-binding protein [Chloroflexota bacterium]
MSPAMEPGDDAHAALDCREVALAYGEVPVVRDLTLAVAPGETVALLGPSGSGKSSLLYAVAGFLRPRSGSISMAGRVVSSSKEWLAPERRSIGMVFQSYALWPHMTALETVAYPLRQRGVSAREARRRAQDLLEGVGIGRLAGRRPAELSGGEQQRVGLCRALARDPGLYLFDEPTAHLDSALRAGLQEQLAGQRHGSKTAALYATHDVAEALAVADRVALLRDGRLVQVGSPVDIYERPVDLWAAQLTGAASLVQVVVERIDGVAATLSVDGKSVVVQTGRTVPAAPTEDSGSMAPEAGIGSSGAIVRPGWLHFGGPLPGRVRQTWYRGPHTDYRLDTPAGEVSLSEMGPPRFAPGTEISWSLDRVWFLTEAGTDVVSQAEGA